MEEGALNSPDHRDNLVLMKLPLLFQAAHKCLTLGSAYNKDFHDLEHFWLNTALIMHTIICEDMQINIIDSDDVMSLCQISLSTKCSHAQDSWAEGKEKWSCQFL